MQRRDFIKNTMLSAVAVSTYGSVTFNGNNYVGDCETTTDILGPYYRPGSPLRNNLVVAGDEGTLVMLRGTVKHNDCKTPYANAKIELWHCNPKAAYDNSSPDYNYRGTVFSDAQGHYQFTTLLPVPYKDKEWRPAHFHLMISAPGYQAFVTQLYFSGDKYLNTDPYASAPNAKKRILKVEDGKDGMKNVFYDVSMSPKLKAETAVIDKLVGTYADINDPTSTEELFKKDGLLWKKNDVYGREFDYAGNNTFKYPGMPEGYEDVLAFELLPGGNVKLTRTVTGYGKPQVIVMMKK